MTRRTRIRFGTLALVAMVFSLGETAWASTCMPGMPMGDAAMQAADDSMSMPMEEAAAPVGTDPDDDLPMDPMPCPFGLVVTQGCGAAPSLPARMDWLPDAGQDARGALFAVRAGHASPPHDAPFRPPRS